MQQLIDGKQNELIKIMIVSTLLLEHVPLLFARFENYSFEGNIPLDFNEFLSVRYNVSIVLRKVHIFLEKRAECAVFLKMFLTYPPWISRP